jgi:putative ABC transport system ATP-binding protein
MKNERPLLHIQNIQKYYGSNNNNIVKALDDISFDVNKGEFLGIMGASGAGKTTLLNCIATIDTVSAGHIILENNDITTLKNKMLAQFRRENLGFIFQDFSLLDNLTIYDNIALALTINGVSSIEIKRRIDTIAKELGIYEILQHYPYEASGGQKQRCACARAIINNPQLVLADEPTGALDSHSAQMLLETMYDMNKKRNTTFIMVTHDALSASYAKRVIFLKDGKIYIELQKGEKERRHFFTEILDVVALLGGERKHVS